MIMHAATNFVDPLTLLDELLKEQQLLTPVARFARHHETGPTQEKYYRDLIPLSTPGQDEQYAFQVDLDACTGCKACVTACHNLNGLEDDEIWRNVGLLHGGKRFEPYQQTITTACHHCVDPACLNGCPVDAYEKEADTGIVRHLDDQCIGCQYCVMKCPYDVPKYSKSKGIVRKCDMCHSRLTAGEAPACVQACPNGAIRIVLVNKTIIRRQTDFDETLVPDAFSSDYTLPTTRYTTRRSYPKNVRAADRHQAHPEHPHWPLIGMLLLTQLSLGAYALSFLENLQGASLHRMSAAGLIACLAGLTCSTLHLGQPLKAWRFFVGLRHSWLSREILAFGIFSGAAFAATGWAWFGSFVPGMPPEWRELTNNITLVGAIATGLIGVLCSVMIYHDTRRTFWRFPISAGKFIGSAFVLGGLTGSLLTGSSHALLLWGLGGSWKWILEIAEFRFGSRSDWVPEKRTVMLMLGPLAYITSTRLLAGLIGSILLPFALFLSPHDPNFWLWGAGLLTLVSEVSERYLYFTAVSAPKMPGNP